MDEIYCCQETTHAFAFTTLPRNRTRVCLPDMCAIVFNMAQFIDLLIKMQIVPVAQKGIR